MTRRPYFDGRVHVLARQCATCVFRPGNPMRLEAGRVAGMVASAVRDGGAITCHETLYGQADQEAVCRGFYDAHGHRVLALELAPRLGILVEVEPPG